jgi:hypothetical protein
VPAFGVYLVKPSWIALVPACIEKYKHSETRRKMLVFHSYGSTQLLIRFSIEPQIFPKRRRIYPCCKAVLTSTIDFGVSKSGSPAASLMTGTPDSTRAVAASAMAMVLDGFKAATLGLIVVSTVVTAPFVPLLLANVVMAVNC